MKLTGVKILNSEGLYQDDWASEKTTIELEFLVTSRSLDISVWMQPSDTGPEESVLSFGLRGRPFKAALVINDDVRVLTIEDLVLSGSIETLSIRCENIITSPDDKRPRSFILSAIEAR